MIVPPGSGAHREHSRSVTEGSRIPPCLDNVFAERVRRAVAGRTDVTEKKMFGGLAFLLNGMMFCGSVKNDLMVRVGPGQYEEALGQARRPIRCCVRRAGPSASSEGASTIGTGQARTAMCVGGATFGRGPARGQEPRLTNCGPFDPGAGPEETNQEYSDG